MKRESACGEVQRKQSPSHTSRCRRRSGESVTLIRSLNLYVPSMSGCVPFENSGAMKRLSLSSITVHASYW